MYAKLQKHWWALPALSAVLLVLTFHPFNIWPLCFVALIPLYVFATGFGHGVRKLFAGGFIVGSGFAFFLSYYTLMQFHWLAAAYLFVDVVRAATVPVSLISGVIVGGLTVIVFKYLYGRSILINALLGGAVYTAAEYILRAAFGGYYLAELGYAATSLPALMVFAPLGGGAALSFIVALCNGFGAECAMRWRLERAGLMRAGVLIVGVLILVGGASAAYLWRPGALQGAISIVVLQPGARDRATFGREQKGVFFWDEGAALAAAASSSPDLLIYPFSPVEGALYRDVAPAFNKDVLVANESAVARFVAGVLPASTTLLTWNNLYAANTFYNEYELWQGGKVVSEYQKRALFPFMDYTPLWAQRIGLFSTPFDAAAGTSDNHLVLGGLSLGDLMCSELHNTQLARQEARRAPLIIAVGSEAMFLDDVASEFSLKAAQLRAAENDVVLVRGNILGPSAIIDRHGHIVASVPAGAAGSAAARISLYAPKVTLYNRLGDWPLFIIICGILGSAWYVSRAARLLPSK